MLGDFGRPLANIVRSEMSTKDEDFRVYRVEEIRRGTADLKTLAAQLNGLPSAGASNEKEKLGTPGRGRRGRKRETG
jgi:hypothetical protein